MKSLCLVLDGNDSEWFTAFRNSHRIGDDTIVVAPTFDGRRLSESLNAPYRAYEDIAFAIDKLEINNLAREKARGWHTLAALADCAALQSIRCFAGYPLLEMHQSLFLLALQEIIQAHRFMHQVLAVEKPDSVLFGERANPFLGQPITFITGSNGVEREVLKSIIRGRRGQHLVFEDFGKSVSLCPPPTLQPVADARLFNFPPQLTGPRILIFAWGDYYLEYFDTVLENLAGQKARIGIALIGGEVAPAKKHALRQKGVCVFDKANWPVAGADRTWSEWMRKCGQAARELYNSKTLEEYFSDGFGTYFPSLVSDFLCKQILDLPGTVVELLRSESIVRAFSPDMVLNHFCIHPFETCDVLPARALGVPTLAVDHGIHGYNDSQRLTFATEYFGVSGTSAKEAIHTAVAARDDSVVVIGNTRYEGIIAATEDAGSVKKRLGLDPDRPVCIFCDSSGWSHMNEWRHSTFSTAASILSLKASIPKLQIIYRVHHGARYQGMERYFEEIGDPDVHFQVSPNPALLDILPAADVVVSHSTSAIGESLLKGVPVVYLTLHGEPEPSYFGCEAIKTADTREGLVQAVVDTLGAGRSRSEVRRLAHSYLDISLEGNDGKASERLGVLIMKLAALPRTDRKAGFQDWLDRIESASRFDAKEFRKVKIGPPRLLNGLPMVSVIIPTRNRHETIGITLESLARQSYPKERYEVLVADNNSSDATRAAVAEWKHRFPVPLTYILEARAGAHNARNTAAKSARGEILYFTDDDMVADPELLTQIVQVFGQEKTVGTATGRVLPKWEAPPPEWVLHHCLNGYLSLNDQGEGIRFDTEDPGVWSCHQAVRRNAFFEAGGYNPDIVNGIAIGDNETGLNIKLKERGYSFAYNGKAVTYHLISKERMTQKYLNNRLEQQGRCDSYTQYRKKVFSEYELRGQIENHRKGFIDSIKKYSIKKALKDSKWHLEEASAHYYLGRIDYDNKLLKDSEWREMVLCSDWLNSQERYLGIIENYSKQKQERGNHESDVPIQVKLSDFAYSNSARTSNLQQFQKEYGYSIIPTSYFEPIPDLREVDLNADYSRTKIMEINFKFDEDWIDSSLNHKIELISDHIIKNPMVTKQDLLLYGQFINAFKPRKIIEIGSGFSACFASALCELLHISTEISSIEPFPNDFLIDLARKGKINLIEKMVQEVNPDEVAQLRQLGRNDILFIDTSHVSTRKSDTNFIFLNILPFLKTGVLIHFHDIYLPYDYIDGYYKLGRFYNEQYLLAALLANSSRFNPLYSTYYSHIHNSAQYGASFWMQAT